MLPSARGQHIAHLGSVLLAILESLSESEYLLKTLHLLVERFDVLLAEAAAVRLQKQVKALVRARRLPLRPATGRRGGDVRCGQT